MTASAVSLGLDVTLVWFDGALDALGDGNLDEPAGGGAGQARPGTIEAAGFLLREARASGRVRFLACSASALAARGGIERSRERVDDVVGWPTVIGLLRASEKSFVW